MKFGDRLRDIRNSRGWSQDEMANILGTSKQVISRYENGHRTPKINIANEYAIKLGVSLEYLLGDDSVKSPELTPYKPAHRIPILGYISAGLPLYAEEHIEGYTMTDLDGDDEYFALRVSGDSMTAARIAEGDILIVRRQPCVENGEIAVVIVKDENATVKRFRQDGNMVTLMPQSFSPDHHPQVYNLKDADIKIIGKVVRNEINF